MKHVIRPDRALQKRWADREKEVPGEVMQGYVDPEAANAAGK